MKPVLPRGHPLSQHLKPSNRRRAASRHVACAGPGALRAVNPLVLAMQRSPLHGVLSQRILLLTVSGHRSGRRFTLLAALRDGNDLLVICHHSEQQRLWSNLRGGGAPVVFHVLGR
jgi:hypothetical protein